VSFREGREDFVFSDGVESFLAIVAKRQLSVACRREERDTNLRYSNWGALNHLHSNSRRGIEVQSRRK
jgi:hypothetical protein